MKLLGLKRIDNCGGVQIIKIRKATWNSIRVDDYFDEGCCEVVLVWEIDYERYNNDEFEYAHYVECVNMKMYTHKIGK